ncbi:WbqC family protein [Luminiphilus sp. nBUS_16]|uniref:WbqC family protein n=1 Tax=Luminiphilus sp. nBUS_16 TaxID=3395315 RepID=UPI003EBCE95A
MSGSRGKKLGVMQPYFLPYIGYFQLIAAVDVFVVYDNIKYTKKGWINRNRMLRNGEPVTFSVPLKKDSDYLTVGERQLAASFSREKLLAQFRGAYSRAPNFDDVYALLESVINCNQENLAQYVYNSILAVCKYLDITTKICLSSGVRIDHELIGQEKVIAMCETLGASTYINLPGGSKIYDKTQFGRYNVALKFLDPLLTEYEQFGGRFVPSLSIIDILMFRDMTDIRSAVDHGFNLV